jgi:hypothetical protein
VTGRRPRLGAWLKGAALASVNRLTGRHAVLLSAAARRADSIIDLRAPYRVDGPMLTLELRHAGPGRLTSAVLAYEGHFPGRTLWTAPARDYAGPCELSLDLTTGSVCLAGRQWGRVPLPLPSRRFCWHLALVGPDGSKRQRLTGHYLPVEGRAIDASYFHGETYVDHEAQSAADHGHIVELLRLHQARGPVLEIGCATGGLLAALDAARLPALGVDISEWAVARATERLGPGRAFVCDVEKEPLPPQVRVLSPFGTLILPAVLEHFRDPFGTLMRLTRVSGAGTTMIITTANSDSLTHAIFGREWEGYFDWTHFGVDQVGVRRLREELARLNWEVVHLSTHSVWDGSADPVHETLRDWWVADARFRRLLTERDLGDFVTCVAVRA